MNKITDLVACIRNLRNCLQAEHAEAIMGRVRNGAPWPTMDDDACAALREADRLLSGEAPTADVCDGVGILVHGVVFDVIDNAAARAVEQKRDNPLAHVALKFNDTYTEVAIGDTTIDVVKRWQEDRQRWQRGYQS